MVKAKEIALQRKNPRKGRPCRAAFYRCIQTGEIAQLGVWAEALSSDGEYDFNSARTLIGKSGKDGTWFRGLRFEVLP